MTSLYHGGGNKPFRIAVRDFVDRNFPWKRTDRCSLTTWPPRTLVPHQLLLGRYMMGAPYVPPLSTTVLQLAKRVQLTCNAYKCVKRTYCFN